MMLKYYAIRAVPNDNESREPRAVPRPVISVRERLHRTKAPRLEILRTLVFASTNANHTGGEKESNSCEAGFRAR